MQTGTRDIGCATVDRVLSHQECDSIAKAVAGTSNSRYDGTRRIRWWRDSPSTQDCWSWLGMLRAREPWLGVLILVAGVNLYWLAGAYLQGHRRREDVIGYPIIGVVIIITWLYFGRLQTRDYFR